MDGESNGKPYEQMDDLGGKKPYFWKHPYTCYHGKSTQPNHHKLRRLPGSLPGVAGHGIMILTWFARTPWIQWGQKYIHAMNMYTHMYKYIYIHMVCIYNIYIYMYYLCLLNLAVFNITGLQKMHNIWRPISDNAT